MKSSISDRLAAPVVPQIGALWHRDIRPEMPVSRPICRLKC